MVGRTSALSGGFAGTGPKANVAHHAQNASNLTQIEDKPEFPTQGRSSITLGPLPRMVA